MNTLNLQDAIVAVQADKKALVGADGAVAAEQADVQNELVILAQKQADLQASQDADVAAKAKLKASLLVLRDATDAEIAAL